MRWPYTKCEFFYLLFYAAYITFFGITQWSLYKSCTAPMQIFLLASEITFFLLINSLIFLRASDLPDWAVKFFSYLIHFVLTPLCIYLPIQGAYWQIINMEKSPQCPAVTGGSLLIWSWIICVFIVGILLTVVGYLKVRNWWRMRQFRNQMMRLNHLASEGDFNALNALLLENGDINDRVGLLPNDIEKLERKDFARSFADRLTGNQNQTCPICFEDYKINDKVITLPKCEHTFHPQCVTGWLLKNPMCPICRGNVRTGLYDPAHQSQDIENRAN